MMLVTGKSEPYNNLQRDRLRKFESTSRQVFGKVGRTNLIPKIAARESSEKDYFFVFPVFAVEKNTFTNDPTKSNQLTPSKLTAHLPKEATRIRKQWRRAKTR